MIVDIIHGFFVCFLLIFSAWFAWESTVLVSEKNERKTKRNGQDNNLW